jgi:hypothetical protein
MDDGYIRGFLITGIGAFARALERKADRIEIARRHGVVHHGWWLLARLDRSALDEYEIVPTDDAHRDNERRARFRDARRGIGHSIERAAASAPG